MNRKPMKVPLAVVKEKPNRGPRRNPNSIAKEFHLERLADDAHIRALDRKAAKKHAKGCPARWGGSCFCK